MHWRDARVAVLVASLVFTSSVTHAQVVTAAPPPLMPSASSEKGAALVTADPQACVHARGFTLTTVTRLAGGGTSRIGMAPVDATPCRWIIEALDPGTYQVHVGTISGIGGSATFTAVAGQITTVSLAPPTVQVSGRVTLNGSPLADAEIWFHGKEAAGMPRVITGPDGTYSATLDRPGEYSAQLSGASLKHQSRSATFRSGANTLDWSLAGGTLTVHVKNWDRLSDVNVRVTTATGSDNSSDLTPDKPPVVVLQGTPFGTYEVSATQKPQRVSRKTITVSLAADHPQAEVTLELGDSRSRLVLIDPD